MFRRLKGRKHLIVGNHDYILLQNIQDSGIFEIVKFIDLIIDNEGKVCVCHYPLMYWMEFNRGGVLVYGHIHNKIIKMV